MSVPVTVRRDDPSIQVLAVRAMVSAVMFVAGWVWALWMWPGLGEGLVR